MGFTTTTFLFVFLPCLLVNYFVCSFVVNKIFKSSFHIDKYIIIIFSFIFYAWALNTTAIMLLALSLVIWLLGICIESTRTMFVPVQINKSESKEVHNIDVARIPLLVGVILTILLLYHFKYYQIMAPIISQYVYIDPNKYAAIIVPLGVSFISFSVISYFADIYSGKATSGSFTDCLLYVFYFPKIVSGPIVLWRDFQPQICSRVISLDSIVTGFNLIAIGFAKKVILADTFGAHADILKDANIDTATAWFAWLLYAMQIYYDFSGYSDIAIGVSRLFGFDIADNFNFPYRSTSITEFWRRWHISLGNFFKNYIYFALGGNRKGKERTLVNLFIVFVVTGIWHGAGMAYIIWGTLHGVCVVIERVVKDKNWYIKIPSFIKWMVTFFISASAWQFFRYGGNGINAIGELAKLFGLNSSSGEIIYPLQYYADNEVTALLIIGCLGATVLGNKYVVKAYNKIQYNNIFYLLQELFVLCLFIISISYMISSNYHPFIYFQF